MKENYVSLMERASFKTGIKQKTDIQNKEGRPGLVDAIFTPNCFNKISQRF